MGGLLPIHSRCSGLPGPVGPGPGRSSMKEAHPFPRSFKLLVYWIPQTISALSVHVTPNFSSCRAHVNCPV